MSVGFGFSVGDFIAAVKVLREVGVALKEHGGARDDYLRTITRLESTKAILSCIASFQDDDEGSATVHAIHSLARLIQNDIECFLAKINKYQKSLGGGETKRYGHGALAKITWSQSIAGKARKLYQDLDSKTSSLDLLFELHLCNASSKERRELVSTREAILHAIDAQSLALSKIPVSSASSDTLAKQDIDALTTGVQTLAFDNAKAANDMMFSMASMATKDDIRALTSLFESKLKTVTSTQHSPNTSEDISRLRLVLTVPQLGLPMKEVTAILKHFSTEATILVKLLFASFFVYFKALLFALPQLVMLCRILRRLPPAISLVLRDNITFEDALGRVQSLQFQQFRHWNVFETSLRCAFESVPGKQKVMRGNYILTSSEHTDQLTSRNWSMLIRPGSVVKMAIALTQIFLEGRQCPRGCRATTEKVSTTEYCCGSCGLLYAVRRAADPPHYGTALEDIVVVSESKAAPVPLLEGDASELTTYDVLLDASASSLSEETEELKAFKRIQLTEAPQKAPASSNATEDGLALPPSYEMDPTGQTAPPGIKPRVTTTLWQDEGCICYQVETTGVIVARREDNHYINGTKLLNVAGMTRGRRDGILKSEKTRHVIKIGPTQLKGVWIPFERALELANREKLTDKLYPLFVYNIGGLLYGAKDKSQSQPVPTDQSIPERPLSNNSFPTVSTNSTSHLEDQFLDSSVSFNSSRVPRSHPGYWPAPETIGLQRGFNVPSTMPKHTPQDDGLNFYERQLTMLELQNRKPLAQANQKSTTSPDSFQNGNDVLRDYQEQLMRLERANEDRLVQARTEQL